MFVVQMIFFQWCIIHTESKRYPLRILNKTLSSLLTKAFLMHFHPFNTTELIMLHFCSLISEAIHSTLQNYLCCFSEARKIYSIIKILYTINAFIPSLMLDESPLHKYFHLESRWHSNENMFCQYEYLTNVRIL